MAALLSPSVQAQDYPNRPIRLIIPYSPGTASDFLSRLTATHISDALGVPVVSENKVGAGGNIAWDFVAKAAPDGYTIGTVATAFASSISLSKGLSYDPLRDFTPIGLNAVIHSVVLVSSALPVYTISDLIRYAKANPGKLTFASAGVGTGSHLSAELFRVLAGIEMTHVPYRGTVNALPDLLENRVSLMFDFVPVSIEHVKSGKLRALAVTMRDRSPLLPNVPTMREAGVADYEFTNWFGIVGPAKMPAGVVAKLNEAIVKGMNSQAMRDEMLRRGGDVVTSTPEEFRSYLKQQVELWARVAKQGGLSLEQ
jgi:tripartite-type tricarboxylate transporter receptor subunit TctC